MPDKRHFVIAATITAALAAGILALAASPSVWQGWRPATCLPDHCFCEAIRDQLVKQPANTASSAAFVGVAVLVLLSMRGRTFGVERYIYASAAALIGFGSIFYHASLTFWGQTADVLGMYLIATFLLLHVVGRLVRLSARSLAAAYVVSNAVLLAGLVAFPGARRYAFGLIIIAVIVAEAIAHRKRIATLDRRTFAAALAIFLASFGIWIADITRMLCAPDALMQGHALWHIGGAAAAWLMFIALRPSMRAG